MMSVSRDRIVVDFFMRRGSCELGGLFIVIGFFGVDIQGVVEDFKTEMLGNRIFNQLNARIAEFVNLSRFNINHVIVLLVAVRLFELRHILTELMLAYQVTRQQQLNGVVQRGSTYAVVLIFHQQVQRLHIEMTFIIVHLFQNGVAFGSFSVTVFFEVSRKNLLYFFLNIRDVLHNCYKYTLFNLYNTQRRKVILEEGGCGNEPMWKDVR